MAKFEAIGIVMNPVNAIELIMEQTKGCKYEPTSALMNINGRVIDVLDPENKEEVEKYLKLNS